MSEQAKDLQPYMLSSRQGLSRDGAILVFAHTAKEAKRVGWTSGVLQAICDYEFIDVAARLLRESNHLYVEANQAKLAEGVSHVIEAPTSCKECLMWGSLIDANRLCEDCVEEGAW